MKRGYFGIGIFQAKHEENVGSLWRSASVFGASLMFTIGRRYKVQASDTNKSYKHIPLFNFTSLEDLLSHTPYGCRIICVENSKNAWPIKNFVHPERAIYLLGSEDNGLPKNILDKYPSVVLPGEVCMNVANCGSIVMFDRFQKQS